MWKSIKSQSPASEISNISTIICKKKWAKDHKFEPQKSLFFNLFIYFLDKE